jgi:hypothetical protein
MNCHSERSRACGLPIVMNADVILTLSGAKRKDLQFRFEAN